jgi:hypothetical protein
LTAQLSSSDQRDYLLRHGAPERNTFQRSSDDDPCVERPRLLLVWNVLRSSEAYTTFGYRDEYAKLAPRTCENLLPRPTRTPILLSPCHDYQRMGPLFRHLPMSCSTAYSNPSASGICLPQISKYLGTLELHLNFQELCILCMICKYALHPDSVTRHVAKHKVPLRERAALTSVVQSLHLPNPKSFSVRSDYSPAHPQLTVRHGYSCTLCSHRTTSSELFGRHMRRQHGGCHATDALAKLEVPSLRSWSKNMASGFWIIRSPDGKSKPGATSVSRRQRLGQLHNLEHRALGVQQANTASDLGGSDMTLINNRTHRTGWNELFAGSDRAILIKLSRTPSRTINGDLLVGKHEGRELRSPAADEMKLRRIPVGLDIALGRCKDTVRHTDISVRCWLRGQTPNRP